MVISRQSGFSMIDVMISVFILALGVIGAAGLQFMALKSNQISWMQTMATQLANEMADKMRTNAKQADLATNNPFLFVYDSKDDPKEPASVCFGKTECNSAAMAAFDVYEMQKAVKDNLPGGKVVICRDKTPTKMDGEAFTWACTNDGPLVIKIGWRGREKEDAGSVVPYVLVQVQIYQK